MQPSQLISRANIDDAYDKLHEEHERLKQSHDFDAKRLRVLARVAGCEDGVPDDATAVACAGTVLGMIRRNVEQIVAERDNLKFKAEAMRLVLAPLSVKAGIAEEKLMALLDEAERTLAAGSV